MRPRFMLLRRIAARSSQPPSLLRTFAQSTVARSGLRTRPQLPFLSVPTTTRSAQRVRYLTTERKARLKYEIGLGIKVTSYIWIALGCLAAASVAVSQEMLEREFPTPHEWSFLTRMRFRGAHCERYQTDPGRVNDWLAIIQWIMGAVERLDDPSIDGKDLDDVVVGDRPVAKDITRKPESWRRGYFEALMMYAKAAEQMDGWVRDTTRKIVFPPGVMIGPSNPNPKGLPKGYTGAPREEDCEIAYPTADEIYQKLIMTKGLNASQRLEAKLAYASWLEFKGLEGPAGAIYEEAVDIAVSQRPLLGVEPLSRESWTLNDAAGPPSANLLRSLTALATFKARHDDVQSALPMIVSILQARRKLPSPAPAMYAISEPIQRLAYSPDDNIVIKFAKQISSLVAPPDYPPPPPDGTTPPTRDAKEICEEAALSLHIGEIMYTSRASSREEGLGWTREAVDIAEEQLRQITSNAADRPARTTCRECLASGLENWATMVARLAREEANKKAAVAGQPKKSTWLGLWGEGKEEDLSRWAAEEKVIQERQRRAKDLLDDLEAPKSGLASLFST